MINSLRFIVLGFCTLWITVTNAQNQYTELTTMFNSLFANDKLNGNALVAANGKMVFEREYGFADFENKISNDRSILFPLASVSKIFTAISILQLRDNGMLNLDDKVKIFVPEFIYDNITIRQLLSHTSGLADYEIFMKSLAKQDGKPFTNADVITTLKANNSAVLSEPGQKFKYSNIGYNILALVVEHISAMSFSDYLNKNIFFPAQMQNTCLLPSTDYCSQPKANNYRYPFSFSTTPIQVDSLEDRSIKMYLTFFNNFYGSDGIWSTTEDLLKFDAALESQAILTKKSFEESTTPVKLNDGELASFHKVSFGGTVYLGLGWFILKDETNGKLVFHDGSNPGCETSFLKNIPKKQLVVVLSNRQDESVNIQALAAVKIINNASYLMPKTPLDIVYARTATANGVEIAVRKFNKLKSDTLSYYFTEDKNNDTGYELLNNKYLKEALALFKINTKLFPNSSNSFDSYAEALALAGDKKSAITNYKKALKIEPQKKSSLDGLAKLE